MASIQPPKKRDSSVGPIVRTFRRHRVRYRKTWNFDADRWVDLDYVEANTVRESAAPSKSSANLNYAHGKVKREDEDAYSLTLPRDLRDAFLQIILLGETTSEKEIADAVLFTGYVPEQTSNLQGVQKTGSDFDYGVPGDETITVVGMEHLLDRDTIGAAYAVNRDEFADAFRIDRVPVFNETYTRGLSQGGNRSTGKYSPSGDTRLNGSYVFTSITEQGIEPLRWSVRDIIEYLLVWFVQGDVRMVLSGDKEVIEALDRIKPPRFDAQGLTIFDAINKLLDRRRGFGWVLRVDAAADDARPTIRVHVFTTLDEAVSVADVTLPANKDTHEIKLDQEKTLADCLVGFNTMTRYGRIVVQGSFVISMFTVSFADHTLREMWTATEEAAYKSVAGGTDAKANDTAREDLKLRHVYTNYKVPREWNWIVRDGLGGSAVNYVVPSINKDGSIDPKQPSLLRDWGQTAINSLPLKREQLSTEHEKEFERPFAMLKVPRKDATGADVSSWEFVDRIDGNRMNLQMLDREFGIQVEPTHNHLLAKNHWTGAAATKKPPELDYSNLLATIAVRADVRLSVSIDLWNDGSANPQQSQAALRGRVLYMDVADAELWYCVPGTVIGVAKDGTLRRYGGDGRLRDDAPYLRQVAAMARAWYSKDRATATINFKQLELGYRPGAYIKTVQDAWGEARLNCIVSERIFDLRGQTTQVQTSFEELRIDGRNNPTPGLGRT